MYASMVPYIIQTHQHTVTVYPINYLISILGLIRIINRPDCVSLPKALITNFTHNASIRERSKLFDVGHTYQDEK